MSMPCPPAPNYVREQGISDCDYLQTTPFVRQRMQQTFDSTRRAYDPNGNQTYSIGGYPMKHSHMGAAPRVFGLHGAHMHGAHMHGAHMHGAHMHGAHMHGAHMHGAHMHGAHMHMGATPRVFGLGRSVLDVSKAQNFNSGSKAVKPSSVGIYGNTSSEKFIKHLWTAQVIALWLTDGNAYKDYRGMSGIVSRNGHSPNDLSPLGIGSDGFATTDLRQLLNGGSTDALFVKGPDGMFGPSAESLIEEYAGTGKIFGKSIPGNITTNPNAFVALTGLAQNVKTPKIAAALAKFEAGRPAPSRQGPARTPCHMLQGAARAARSDCPQDGKINPPTPKPPKPQHPKPPKAPATAAEDTPWLLYGGIAAGVLLLGGAGYYYWTTTQEPGSDI